MNKNGAGRGFKPPNQDIFLPGHTVPIPLEGHDKGCDQGIDLITLAKIFGFGAGLSIAVFILAAILADKSACKQGSISLNRPW